MHLKVPVAMPVALTSTSLQYSNLQHYTPSGRYGGSCTCPNGQLSVSIMAGQPLRSLTRSLDHTLAPYRPTALPTLMDAAMAARATKLMWRASLASV